MKDRNSEQKGGFGNGSTALPPAPAWAASLEEKEHMDFIIAGVIAALLTIYLGYALLCPEKF